jgi:hypothetical protein
MGPMGFPKTSVRNYHYMMYNIPEECRSQELNGSYCSLCYHGYHVMEKEVKRTWYQANKDDKTTQNTSKKISGRSDHFWVSVWMGVKHCMHAYVQMHVTETQVMTHQAQKVYSQFITSGFLCVINGNIF